MSSSLSTTDTLVHDFLRLLEVLSLIVVGLALATCSSTDKLDVVEEIMNGTIAYPFVDENEPLGRNGPDDKFVIRSAVGGAEYTIEIPGAARDYDVQVPLAAMDGFPNDKSSATRPRDLGNPMMTDREMIAAMPSLESAKPTDTALMDGAFGVGSPDGPRQSPSYTMGLVKINELFKGRQYEFALVELNNLLAFYPNSPKLHKMKGTVLVKMRNLELAELAWIKALELTPQDKTLQVAVARLQKRIIAMGKIPTGMSLDGTLQIPTPVGTIPPTAESAIGH